MKLVGILEELKLLNLIQKGKNYLIIQKMKEIMR